MNTEFMGKSPTADHMGCFGNFSLEDPICKRLCALNLRCAIERDQNVRLKILNDLVAADDICVKLQ